jgi:hypothetical protein
MAGPLLLQKQLKQASSTGGCDLLQGIVCHSTDPYDQKLCKVLTSCCSKGEWLPFLGDQTCLDALTQLTVDDLTTLGQRIAKLAPDAASGYCRAVKEDAQWYVGQSQEILNDRIQRLTRWYINTVIPATEKVCGGINENVANGLLLEAYMRVQRSMCGSTDVLNYPKSDLFVLQHWKKLALGLGLLVLILIILTVSLSWRLRQEMRLHVYK